MKKILIIGLAAALVLGLATTVALAGPKVTVEWNVEGTGTVSHDASFNGGDRLSSSVDIDVASGWNEGTSVASWDTSDIKNYATFSTNWTALGVGNVDLQDFGRLDYGKNNQAQLFVDYGASSSGSQSVDAGYIHRFIVHDTAEVWDGSIKAFLQHDPQNGSYPTVISTTNLTTDVYGEVVQYGNTSGSDTEHDISAFAAGDFTMDSTSVGEVDCQWWHQNWTIALTAEGNEGGVLELNTETNKAVGTTGSFLTGALSDSQSVASFDVDWGYRANFSGTAFGHYEEPAPGDILDIVVPFSRDVVGSGSDEWDALANWVQIGGSFGQYLK